MSTSVCFNYPDLVPAVQTAGVLDAADEYMAYVAAAPKTGTIKKIGWTVQAVSSPSGIDLYVALETVADSAGVPVAATRALATLLSAGAESAKITDPSAGVRYDAINGATGVSVTKGQLMAVTIRCTARTSGSVSVPFNQYRYPMLKYAISTSTYTIRDGASGYSPTFSLEYDGEIVPTPFVMPAHMATTDAWNSTSNPDRRGAKFRFPDFSCTARALMVLVDLDYDADVILYDSDEYTVMTGFPISLQSGQRKSTAPVGMHYVEFPTNITFAKNTYYRIVLLPKETSDIVSYYVTFTDDDTLKGIDGTPEGENFIYTTFNGDPSSGSHAWTDKVTQRPLMALDIVSVDFAINLDKMGAL